MNVSKNKNYLMTADYGARALDRFHLILCPSYGCNLSCRHCYLPSHYKNGMDFPTVRDILFQWSEIVRLQRGRLNGIFHVKGGEPLTLPYLYELFDLLVEKHTCSLMLTTNGTLGNSTFFSKIRELDNNLENSTTIIVSLDGSRDEIHGLLRGGGNFDKTLTFISRLADQGINVHLNYVVHRKNIFDLEDFVGLALTLGVNQINFLKFNPKGFGQSIKDWAIDNEVFAKRMIEVYESSSFETKTLLAGNLGHIVDRERGGVCTSCECVSGYKGLLYILPNGDVFPCPNLLESEMCLGNIERNSLNEIHGNALDELYFKIKTGCDLRYQCKGDNISLLYAGIDRLAESYEDGISYCYSRNF